MGKAYISDVMNISNELLGSIDSIDKPEAKDIEALNAQIDKLSGLTTSLLSQKVGLSAEDLYGIEQIHFIIHRKLAKKAKKIKAKGIKRAEIKMGETREKVASARADLKDTLRSEGRVGKANNPFTRAIRDSETRKAMNYLKGKTAEEAAELVIDHLSQGKRYFSYKKSVSLYGSYASLTTEDVYRAASILYADFERTYVAKVKAEIERLASSEKYSEALGLFISTIEQGPFDRKRVEETYFKTTRAQLSAAMKELKESESRARAEEAEIRKKNRGQQESASVQKRQAGYDLYYILGVSSTATEEEIKAAHRRLAKETYPGVNAEDPEATRRFIEIERAYEILGDPKKRKAYDETGNDKQ